MTPLGTFETSHVSISTNGLYSLILRVHRPRQRVRGVRGHGLEDCLGICVLVHVGSEDWAEDLLVEDAVGGTLGLHDRGSHEVTDAARTIFLLM